MKKTILKTIALVAILSPLYANALATGQGVKDASGGALDNCGYDSVSCTSGIAITAVSSLPTFLVGADGSKIANPKVLKAINATLRNTNATPAQIAEAMSRLEELANN